MKKTVLAIAATMLMSASAMAQDDTQARRDRREFNPEQMIQKRTDDMVKTYGLNEEQAAKVLELNKKRSEQMRSMRQHRGQQMRPEGRQPMKKDSLNEGQRPQRMERDGMKRPDRPRMEKGARDNGRLEMRKQMEEYDNALKEIMTEEQFKAYKSDQEKRMKEGPHRARPADRTQKQ